jgi:hypothetical protein
MRRCVSFGDGCIALGMVREMSMKSRRGGTAGARSVVARWIRIAGALRVVAGRVGVPGAAVVRRRCGGGAAV